MVTRRASPTSTSVRPILSKDEKTSDKDEEAKEDNHEEGGEAEVDEQLAVPVAGEESELRKPRIGRRPLVPTKAGIEDHFLLHLTYRSWCRHCVSGKARLAQHIVVKEEDRERLGATWNADYAFTGSKEADEGMQPTLVMYDDDNKSFWAMGVNQKASRNRSSSKASEW